MWLNCFIRLFTKSRKIALFDYRTTRLLIVVNIRNIVLSCNSSRTMTFFGSDAVGDIIKCVNFAAIKHKQQRRKDVQGTPYINHPIGVAHILSEEAGIQDPAVIQAALLHDTVEDTDTTLDELKDIFGTHIASIVAEVTDDKNLSYEERKRLQIENAPKSSREAKLVKLADKLHNLRDLESSIPVGWTEQRAKEYFKWAEKVVDGLRGTNNILEERLNEIFSRNRT